METITCKLMASTPEAATLKVAERLQQDRRQRLGAKLKLTGNAWAECQDHLLMAVEVEVVSSNLDRSDAWVYLTSYGITPEGLNSRWEKVPGIGK